MTDTSNIKPVSYMRPLHLMTLIVMYILGVGFARYLGQRIDLAALMMGLLWLLSISLGLNFLSEYFHSPFDRGLVKLNEIEENSGNNKSDRNEIYLWISVACLAIGAVLSLILGISGHLSLSSIILLFLFFLLYSLLIIPGIALDLSGIGEFLTSIVLVALPPAFAYLLQAGEFHRFLYLGIFPLFPLHLALILILRLRTYPMDIKIKRKTLMVRLGWQRGIFLHNLLLLSGFMLFGVALLFGMPFRLIIPVFIALPAAGYLVWYLSKLQDGAPVRWPMITLLSLIGFFLPIYLVTFTVWIR